MAAHTMAVAILDLQEREYSHLWVVCGTGHVTVLSMEKGATGFFVLFLCLLTSILATVQKFYKTCNHIVFALETLIVVVLSVECVLRVWSAGCRSRYQGHYGRLQFIRRPLCILDIVVVIASSLIIIVGSDKAMFLHAAFRGLRFLQILRMVRLDRRGNTWKLLGSVVWAHRQELLTTWYIGFLALISVSFLVYTLENEGNPEDYGTLPDAMWYGLVTLMTVGYGDKTPASWQGKLAAAVLAFLGISFFALPAGILGSGFALQVQQQQRQKHFARRRHPAAMLIQCLWRCYAADPNSCSLATWKPHLKPVHSPTTTGSFRSSKLISRLSIKRTDHGPGLERCNSDRWHRDYPGEEDCKTGFRTNNLISRLSIKRTANSPMLHRNSERLKRNGEFSDDHDDTKKSGLHLSDGTVPPFSDQDSVRSQSRSFRHHHSGGVTKLTEAHKNAIRAIRKIRFFVARRKFKEAFRPYDVKDVIEQYSSGHADMLARIKSLQQRLDQILGKPGADRRKGRGGSDLELYDPSVSLLSRVVKVERRVTLIDRKLDMLIEMYREERHAKNATECRSDDRDDSHESELDTAPKGFANRRRGAWSPNTQRQGSGHKRTESTDTSSATSPADPVVPSQLKPSSSHPSLNAACGKESITMSHSHQEFGVSKDEPGSQALIPTDASVQDNVFVIDAKQSEGERTERTAKEPVRSALRRKKPLRGGMKESPKIQTPQSGDSVTPSGESTVSFGSTGSLKNTDGETRI
ncbi:potassium voltage-gated channel subfamily KQT member 1-like [Amphiura filiformis]|uniref:potassium voltage-gated channel subfamily KQT member 1-like n=1 Tax=Amphiura filiformis TaxID=82378 RepID=UPI003B21FAC5